MNDPILEQLERARTGDDVPSRKNKVFPSTYEGQPVFVKVFNSTEKAEKGNVYLVGEGKTLSSADFLVRGL